MRRIALLVVLMAACGCESHGPARRFSAPHAAPARDGFQFARADRGLSFPNDFASHPGYQTEWWYYTGNLLTEHGRHFGYQLTFFRRSLKPPDQTAARDVDTAANEVFMAHFALTDSHGGRQYSFERFSRGAAPLAGVSASPTSIWLDDWRVDALEGSSRRLIASTDDVAVDLELLPSKGPVPHGLAGYSRKGQDPRRASHYYSFPRLRSRGTVRLGSESFPVNGASWMDHEFTSSGLADHQVGWDWFSIQLDDGIDLMLFHLRTEDGGVDPFSSGSLIDDDGAATHLRLDEFDIAVTDEWESPDTGARYPAEWRIRVPARQIDVVVRPRVADQELLLSFVYWEGAVAVTGTVAGRPVAGQGYVELTGYAATMQGAF